MWTGCTACVQEPAFYLLLRFTKPVHPSPVTVLWKVVITSKKKLFKQDASFFEDGAYFSKIVHVYPCTLSIKNNIIYPVHCDSQCTGYIQDIHAVHSDRHAVYKIPTRCTPKYGAEDARWFHRVHTLYTVFPHDLNTNFTSFSYLLTNIHHLGDVTTSLSVVFHQCSPLSMDFMHFTIQGSGFPLQTCKRMAPGHPSNIVIHPLYHSSNPDILTNTLAKYLATSYF